MFDICIYIFYVKNFQTFLHSVCSRNISTHSPSLRRYTFLSHLTTKSKISVRWIKKLVAATYGVAPDICNNVRSNDVPAPYLTFDFWRNQTITMSEENIQPKAHIIYKHIFALYVSQTVASGRFPTPIFVSVKYIKIITTLCQENIKLKSLNNL